MVRFWRQYAYCFGAFLSFYPAAVRVEHPEPMAAVLGNELTSSNDKLPADHS